MKHTLNSALVLGLLMFSTLSLARDTSGLVRMHSPVLGNASAPVVIVEFFDPACESCREFHPVVKRIRALAPERIAVVMRYVPFHRGADQIVALLEASRKQGKFWPVLDALMASQPDWTPHHRVQLDRVWKHLGGLGLNMAQLRADMASPGIAAIIKQDMADASKFKVGGTPTFFVNGRMLNPLDDRQLKRMVEEELRKAK